MVKYKGIFPYNSIINGYNLDISHNVAHTLYDAGVQKVYIPHHFIAGHKDTNYLDIWTNNICCEPDVYVEYIDKFKRPINIPLLWAILKELNINYSGGAGGNGSGYMGAGYHRCHMIGWKVKHLDPEIFNLKICSYFNAIKEHHAL